MVWIIFVEILEGQGRHEVFEMGWETIAIDDKHFLL
jgi:hypothetical protein